MRAIRFFLTLILNFVIVLLFTGGAASASDEVWGIFQFRMKLQGSQQVFAEYVRRDRVGYFESRNLDLFRLSYGAKIEDSSWGYLVGGAFIDFETGGEEHRLHQFAVYNRTLENVAGVLGRFGFEQRQFTGEDSIYWRIRNRLQLNLLPQFAIGPSVYDEIIYAVDGRTRFAAGFNENRFGVGLRYHREDFEVLIYHTAAHLKTLRREDRVEWLQLQTIYSF
jgi:hypothetical protein